MINYFDEIQYNQKRINDLEYSIICDKDNNYYAMINKIKSQKKREKTIEGYKKVGWFDYDKHVQTMEHKRQIINDLKNNIAELQIQWNAIKQQHSTSSFIIADEDFNKHLCDKVWNRRESR